MEFAVPLALPVLFVGAAGTDMEVFSLGYQIGLYDWKHCTANLLPCSG